MEDVAPLRVVGARLGRELGAGNVGRDLGGPVEVEEGGGGGGAEEASHQLEAQRLARRPVLEPASRRAPRPTPPRAWRAAGRHEDEARDAVPREGGDEQVGVGLGARRRHEQRHARAEGAEDLKMESTKPRLVLCTATSVAES